MKRLIVPLIILVSLVAFPLCFAQEAKPKPATASAPKPEMIVKLPDAVIWGPLPPEFLSGKPSVEMGGSLETAVVAGDPHKTGPYVLRAKCTDGTKIAPHWHPTAENVTVLQGGLAIGMGAKWDDASMTTMPTGGFSSVPPHMTHFAACKGDTIMQMQGNGPFKIRDWSRVRALGARPGKSEGIRHVGRSCTAAD